MSKSGRDPATGEKVRKPEDAASALSLMEQALGLIDRLEGPIDAGAHLDLAIERLKGWMQADAAR